MHWKSHAFYCLRKGILNELNCMHEDLAFNKSPPGAYWDKVNQDDNYPVFSNSDLAASSFTDVLESE